MTIVASGVEKVAEVQARPPLSPRVSVHSTRHDEEKGSPVCNSERTSTEETKDPNIVDWNGPDDPEKPLNWSNKKKWTNIMLISTITLLTPFGSSMFAPGVPDMMREFRSDNIDLASFVVSIYVLGYAFGPLLVAPLSELYGRIWVYHICTFLFLVWTIACGFANNMTAILVFRFLAGAAGSCPLTIGSGTIADCWKQEERGRVMSVWCLPVLLGPTLGPVAGSYLTAAAGWRWNFYLLTVWAGIMLLITIPCMPETYPPVLLAKKAQKLRNETGNMNLRVASNGPSRSPGQLILYNIVRPIKMLFLSPIVFALSLYIAVVYGYLYIMFSTMTTVFQSQYHISQGNVGLTFLGIGIGQFIGLILFGAVSDSLVKREAAKNGGEMKPEFRLPFILYTSLFVPIGLFIYGWSTQYQVHWIVPIIGTVFIAFGLICVFLPIGTYLVDAFTSYAASAMAATTVLRSLGGALLPLSGRKLYNLMGLGWGNSLLAFVALAFVPAIYLLMKYAERIRKHPRFQINL